MRLPLFAHATQPCVFASVVKHTVDADIKKKERTGMSQISKTDGEIPQLCIKPRWNYSNIRGSTNGISIERAQ